MAATATIKGPYDPTDLTSIATGLEELNVTSSEIVSWRSGKQVFFAKVVIS
jgi:hypothetical protein